MNIRKKTLERITITGKYKEKEKAYEYLDKRGYWITSSGPIMVSKHRADFSRFKFIAEKEI